MKIIFKILISLQIQWVLLASVYAAAEIENAGVGNVTTTSVAVCWSLSETADSSVQVFSDAGGVTEITDQLQIEVQTLRSGRREVGTTPVSREAVRDLQETMNQRGVALVKISGLQPASDYWIRAVASNEGSVEDSSALLSATTAARAGFIVEARQIVVDFSSLAVRAGDLSGVIVRVANLTSPYPLFVVVNDVVGSNKAYVDLTRFLDATGETNLLIASGSTLDLSMSYLGTPLITGNYNGNEVAYDGAATAAKLSTSDFTVEGPVLTATPQTATGVLGIPFKVDFEALDELGATLPGFNGTLVLTSSVIDGGSLETAPLLAGILNGAPVALNAVGTQSVTVTDPGSGVSTSFGIEILPYTYENYRQFHFGDLVSADGDPTANGDGDIFNNFQEFVHGLDPTQGNGVLQIGGDGSVSRGGPLFTMEVSGEDQNFSVTYIRPKNYQALGMDFTPEISNQLVGWFSSPSAGTVIGEDDGMEVVQVPFPEFTPEPAVAKYFRLKIEGP